MVFQIYSNNNATNIASTLFTPYAVYRCTTMALFVITLFPFWRLKLVKWTTLLLFPLKWIFPTVIPTTPILVVLQLLPTKSDHSLDPYPSSLLKKVVLVTIKWLYLTHTVSIDMSIRYIVVSYSPAPRQNVQLFCRSRWSFFCPVYLLTQFTFYLPWLQPHLVHLSTLQLKLSPLVPSIFHGSHLHWNNKMEW